jgi:ubiquinone/menaquinone biosynthesis C-methylase UbiE
MLRRAKNLAKETQRRNVEFHRGDALKLPLESRSVDATFCVMVLHFLADPQRAVTELCRITRGGGSVIIVDLVKHNQPWMREQMAHHWLGFDKNSVEAWFRGGGAREIDYHLTGSFAGEKLARNGNRPVEIFVARASLPMTPRRQPSKRGDR